VDVSVRDKALVMEPVGSRWERLVEEIRKEAAERGLTERDIFVGIARARRGRS
jgi:hypothetical protein